MRAEAGRGRGGASGRRGHERQGRAGLRPIPRPIPLQREGGALAAGKKRACGSEELGVLLGRESGSAVI